MRTLILNAVFCALFALPALAQDLTTSALAEGATTPTSPDALTTVFPPKTVSGRGCPVGENTILAWKNGAQTTYCLTPQQVLLYALPDCKDGEIVVFHEDDDQGRVPVGSDDIKIAKFVCEPKPKLKCTTARRNTQQQSVPLIVNGDSGAVSNVNQNARAWGMQCQNGYVRTGCYIATGTKGVQDSDLYSSNGLDCLSDNEEAAYADITIVCCTMK